jgi:acyl-CoA reductase-like NAD-dependent aldehyde dehydrogenase
VEIIKNFIDGEWIESSTGGSFDSTNPADRRDTVGVVTKSGTSDVDRAFDAAKRAFRSWRLVPAAKRGEILFRAAEGLLQDKTRLGELVTREMGKVIAEGLGDVQEAIDIGYYLAGEGRRLSGETVPSELRDKDIKTVREPVGIFSIITPWNFPIAIPAWKLFSALIAGNTVVFKPSKSTPVCATELVRKFEAAGLPKGVLNLIHGTGGDIGEYLATHPLASGLSFTGSSAVGESLISRCARPGHAIACEMGGKNAIIVMEDADLDLAVEGAVWGGFGTTGQRCTAASRVIIHKDVYGAFKEKLIAAAKGLKIGNGLFPGTDVGPLVSDEQLKKVQHYIQIGRQEGVNIACGGQHLTHGELGYGYFFEPTILAEADPKMKTSQEEIFGPVVSLIKVNNFDEAIEAANGVQYGLVASIYTNNIRYSALAERELETGIVYINASTIGAEVQLPFGGEKKSGFGSKEAGGRGGALDLFTRWKTIYRDFSGKLQKAQIE